MGSKYGDVIYNTEVHWLSRGAMLKRMYDLKNYIQLFVEMKEYPFPQFEDKEWMCDFAFLVAITQHLNDLKMELQAGLFITCLIKLMLSKANSKFGTNICCQTTRHILHT